MFCQFRTLGLPLIAYGSGSTIRDDFEVYLSLSPGCAMAVSEDEARKELGSLFHEAVTDNPDVMTECRFQGIIQSSGSLTN